MFSVLYAMAEIKARKALALHLASTVSLMSEFIYDRYTKLDSQILEVQKKRCKSEAEHHFTLKLVMMSSIFP